MQLRGIHFRPVFNAAGAQGFFGEGYPYHRWWKRFGLTFENCGFIAKTTTLLPRPGHMPLQKDGITPKEWKPKCIVVKFAKGVVLNSVGLSGPGLIGLLIDGRWQDRSGEPFFLSFMSVEKHASDRLAELREFITVFKRAVPKFKAPVGLEINFSCPNAGLNPLSLVNEVGMAFNIAGALGIPLQAKFNATAPPKAICEACRHSACDAVTMSNTIPWGVLPDRINWRQLFGTTVSPLERYGFGGGGLSGWPLTPIVCDWIKTARDCGFTKPLWACGGIDSCRAVDEVYAAGANGVQLGVVAMLRPWRMRTIIQYANTVFAERRVLYPHLRQQRVGA
jgi:dihydroorotate dehydrogenase